ncbi:MAG: glycosyltransferase family 9 protein [archaeon]
MKILIINLSGIGDVLMSIPLVKEIKKIKPDSNIDFLVMWPGAKSILEGVKEVNKIHQINMLKEGFMKSLAFCLKLKKENYDVSINTCIQAKIHYDLAASIIKAKRKIGFVYYNYDKLFFKDRVNFNYEDHIVNQNLKALELLESNYKLKKIKPEIELSKRNIKFANEFIKNNKLNNKRLIGIHVGSGTTKNMALKRWPINNYKDILEKVLINKGDIILLFGKEDENQQIKEHFKSKRVIIVESNDMKDSVALIKKCRIFLSADTVFMHLAAINNIKQIVISGPGLNKNVMPLNKKAVIISKHLECQPCYRYGKSIKCKLDEKIKCVRSISVNEVYDEIKKILR